MRPGRPGQRGTRRSVGNRNSAPPRQERSPPFATGIEWARPRPAVGGAATKKTRPRASLRRRGRRRRIGAGHAFHQELSYSLQ